MARNRALRVRTTDHELRVVDAAARRCGLTRSEWLRRIALERAVLVIEQVPEGRHGPPPVYERARELAEKLGRATDR